MNEELIEQLKKINLVEKANFDQGIGLESLIKEFVDDVPSLPEEAKVSRMRSISDYYKEVYSRTGKIDIAYEETRKWAMKIYVQNYVRKIRSDYGLANESFQKGDIVVWRVRNFPDETMEIRKGPAALAYNRGQGYLVRRLSDDKRMWVAEEELFSLNESQHSRSKCMNCSNPPTVEVKWAEGMAHAWFCDKHFEEWKKEHAGDIDYVKKITNGEASKKFSDNKNLNITESSKLGRYGLHWTDGDGMEGIIDRQNWEAGYVTTNPRYQFGGKVYNFRFGIAIDLTKVPQDKITKPEKSVPWEENELYIGTDVSLAEVNGPFIGLIARDILSAKQLQRIMHKVFEEPDMSNYFDIYLLKGNSLVKYNNPKYGQKVIRLSEHNEDISNNFFREEQWFVERTNRHIGLVQKAAEKIVKAYPEFKELLDNVKHHDASKFEEPEKTPYISLTWNKKIGNKSSDPEITKATEHHCLNNQHHPEYWAGQASIDPNNRDKSTKCLDASKMPDIAIAEMIADWAAMGEELGNSPRAWWDKVRDTRWHFSLEQEQLIDKLLEVFKQELVDESWQSFSRNLETMMTPNSGATVQDIVDAINNTSVLDWEGSLWNVKLTDLENFRDKLRQYEQEKIEFDPPIHSDRRKILDAVINRRRLGESRVKEHDETKAAKDIQDLINVQANDPIVKDKIEGDYFRGLANGLIVAKACVDGEEPKFVNPDGSLDEANNQFLYHVTDNKAVLFIDKNGIVPKKVSNWVKAGGGNFGKGNEVFAFEDASDAIRWAARMDWEFNKDTGSGKIVIVKIRKTGNWTEDTNDLLSHLGSRGKWLKKVGKVDRSDIVSITPVTSEMVKQMVSSRDRTGTSGDMSNMFESNDQDPFTYQDSNQEELIHTEWNANSFRYVLEGTGDIFRELCKKYSDFGYIMEKVRRLQYLLEDYETNKVHPDDSIEKAQVKDKEKLAQLLKLWKNQPVDTEEQILAKNLNIALVQGDLTRVKVFLSQIKSLKYDGYQLKLEESKMSKVIESVMSFLGMNENLGEHSYSSTQVQLPNNLAEKVLAFGLTIPDDQIYTDPNDTTFGRELDIHITVKYGLTTLNAEEINRQLNWLKEPLEVRLEKVSCFYGKEQNKPYDVIKIEVTSPSLNEMHKLLSKLPNEDKFPEYVPHVTIAYVKEGFGKLYDGKKDFEGLNFKFDSVMFMGSDNSSKEVVLGE